MAKILEKAASILTGWSGFQKSLDKGDLDAARSFLAKRDLPTSLAEVLVQIRPLAKDLKETIAAGEAAESPGDLRLLLGTLHKMHPQTVLDAEEQTAKMCDVDRRIRAAEAAKNAADDSTRYLGALYHGFFELFEGTSSVPLQTAGAVIIPPMVSNALNAAGFDPDLLWRAPWTEAFKRQSVEPKRRFRLVAN